MVTHIVVPVRRSGHRRSPRLLAVRLAVVCVGLVVALAFQAVRPGKHGPGIAIGHRDAAGALTIACAIAAAAAAGGCFVARAVGRRDRG